MSAGGPGLVYTYDSGDSDAYEDGEVVLLGVDGILERRPLDPDECCYSGFGFRQDGKDYFAATDEGIVYDEALHPGRPVRRRDRADVDRLLRGLATASSATTCSTAPRSGRARSATPTPPPRHPARRPRPGHRRPHHHGVRVESRHVAPSSPGAPDGFLETSCPHCGAPVTSPFCTSCGQAASGPPAAAPLFAPTTARTPRPAAPITPPPAAAPRGRGARTLLLRAGIAFLVLVGLGIGGVLGYQWWRDRPATQALDTADAAVRTVTDSMADADTLADLGAAASSAPASAEKVSDALADLCDDETTLAQSVRPVLESQQTFLEALAPLEGLSDESLTVWGSTLPTVQESLTDVLAARRVLASYDAGAAGHVGNPVRSIEHAVEVVGSSATESLTGQLEELLVELEGVGTTREAAVLGERAGPLAESAGAAEAGQDSTDLDSLVSLGEAFGAIASLDTMDPESLSVWASYRASLTSASENVGLDASAAADSMSGWVSRAQKKMDAWQAAYDVAEAQRSAATSGLDTYSASVRRTLRQYDRARDATSDALEEADLDDYSSGYTVEYAMEEGVLTRRGLLNDLEAVAVPTALASEHSGLETILDSAIEAMRTGEQAVEDWNLCYSDCAETYRDTSGWQTFSNRSGQITDEFDRSLKAWNGALDQALANANAVPLPAVPKV